MQQAHSKLTAMNRAFAIKTSIHYSSSKEQNKNEHGTKRLYRVLAEAKECLSVLAKTYARA